MVMAPWFPLGLAVAGGALLGIGRRLSRGGRRR
jgi:hypothetical protein